MRSLIWLLLLTISSQIALSAIQVDPETQHFVDEYQRTRIFHGVNAVYKNPPFYPPVKDKFHVNDSLAEEDVQNLQRWGMNIVRLLVAWEGVEPKKGEYNMTYINEVKNIVKLLGKYGIHVILDYHQDIYSRRFCGNGFPLWASREWKTFPMPLQYSIRRDNEGNALREDCLKYSFFTMYLAAQVGEEFQRVYDNTDNLADHFAAFWELVAKEFSEFPNVIGYEFINEPWCGDMYRNPSYFIEPGKADRVNLNPLYQRLAKSIRKHDQQKIIFYEPSVADSWHKWCGLQPPEGKEMNHRQAFSFHIYCGIVNSRGDPKWPTICKGIDQLTFKWKLEHSQELGGGRILSEFGALSDDPKGVEELTQVLDAADKYLLSTTYWQFKYFSDHTTQVMPGSTEGFYHPNGTLQRNKVAQLSRTYARAICGTPQTMRYKDGNFVLEYIANKGNCGGMPTEIYLNEEMNYPNGYKYQISPADRFRAAQDPNLLRIFHPEHYSGAVKIQIVKL